MSLSVEPFLTAYDPSDLRRGAVAPSGDRSLHPIRRPTEHAEQEQRERDGRLAEVPVPDDAARNDRDHGAARAAEKPPGDDRRRRRRASRRARSANLAGADAVSVEDQCGARWAARASAPRTPTRPSSLDGGPRYCPEVDVQNRVNDEVAAPIHTLEHDGGKAPAKRLPPSPLFCPAGDAPMLPSELAVYDALAARAQSGTMMATAPAMTPTPSRSRIGDGPAGRIGDARYTQLENAKARLGELVMEREAS